MFTSNLCRCHLGVLIAAVAFLRLMQLNVIAAACTAQKQQGDCNCAKSVECQVKNSGCNTRIVSYNYNCCVVGDPADNCRRVTGQQQLCGTCYRCDKVGGICLTGGILALLSAEPVSSAGDCTIPG